MSDLRKAIIRLAHSKPELREDLLPVLKKAYNDDPTFEDFKASVKYIYRGLASEMSSLERGELKASPKKGYVMFRGDIDYQGTKITLEIGWNRRMNLPEIDVQIDATDPDDEFETKVFVDDFVGGDPENDGQTCVNLMLRIVRNPYNY